MEKTFERRIIALEGIFEFIEECFASYHLDDSLHFLAKFVVEELFTNMVKYNQTTNDRITLRLDRSDHALIISLTDYNVEPFDPRGVPDVDTSKPARERIAGGLGIYLIKKMVDKVDYEYLDRRSKITVTKYLKNEYV